MFARRTEWPLESNALTREIESRRERGLPVLDLTESNPTRCGFYYDSASIQRALAKPEALIYKPEPRGALPAREAVAGYYAEHGVAVDPQHIFLTASTSEAYSYLFRLLGDPGDAVLVPRPSYPLFDFLAGLNDLEIISYPLAYCPNRGFNQDADGPGWQIDLDELSACLDRAGRVFHLPRAVIVVHPNNPTGSFVSAGQISILLALCRRHDLALIADEVFRDYALRGPDVSSLPATHAQLDSTLTFTLSGLSKVSALPQMKLAWIVVSGPPERRDQALERLEIIADTYLSVGAPVAAALPELLETRRAIQPQIIARLRHNLAELDRQLAARSCAAGLQVEGGWYAVLELTGSEDSADKMAVELAREEGVLMHPGHFYEFPSDGYLVLSLITPEDQFAEGIRKLIARLEA